ncbi:MAG: ankyrin repeat domain-containing protein, partial [bacterium]|nr:ankyrin repeat domain-containing protein [bacterium]
MDTHLTRYCQKHLDLVNTKAQKMKETIEMLSDSLLRANHRIEGYESLKKENEELKRRVKNIQFELNSSRKKGPNEPEKDEERKGEEKESSNGEGSSLIEACLRADDKMLTRLLRAPNCQVNEGREKDGVTPLHIACKKGWVEGVKLLLNSPRIEVNKVTKPKGWFPIHFACFYGRLEVLKLLLSYSQSMAEKGFKRGIIDLNKSNSEGATPLFFA